MRWLISLSPTVRCIGVASRFGAPFSGCERALEVLRQAGPPSVLRHNGLAAEWREMAVPEPSTAALGILLRDLADATAAAILAGDRPLIIGGDHSMATGNWRGIGCALGEAPGLICIDAHLDAHIRATSPSGNAHGMPLAALLGLGDPAMVDIPGPALNPTRTVVIGVYSYEPAEVEQPGGNGCRGFRHGRYLRTRIGRGICRGLAHRRQRTLGHQYRPRRNRSRGCPRGIHLGYRRGCSQSRLISPCAAPCGNATASGWKSPNTIRPPTRMDVRPG